MGVEEDVVSERKLLAQKLFYSSRLAILLYLNGLQYSGNFRSMKHLKSLKL